MSDSKSQSTSSPVRTSAATIAWCVVWMICVFMAGTALLPLFPVNWWWVRIGDFPRLQLLIGYLVVTLLLLPFFRRRAAWKWTVVMLVCVAIQCVKIFPYLPIAPREVETVATSTEQSRLRIMSANVLQKNDQHQRLLRLVHDEDPDVLALVEVNQRWLDALQPLQNEFSHQLLHPLENKYGMALLSKYPLKSKEVRFVVKDSIPSIVATVTLPGGHDVRLFVVHPNPPRPGESTTKRDGELVLIGRDVAKDENSAVVMGDLNDVGWSRTTNLFQEVSGLLDPRKGRGMYPTFNAKSSIWRYPLDHLFHTDDFRLVELRTLRDVGSDHFPLLVELNHQPSAAATQEAPNLDAGDHEDAEEAVENAQEAVENGE